MNLTKQFVKRKKERIVRFVKYDEKRDPENHYREQLILYTPWRDESRLAQGYDSYQDKYHADKEQISKIRNQYMLNSAELDAATEMVDSGIVNFDSNVGTAVQHSDEIDARIGSKQSAFYGCFDPGTDSLHGKYDLMNDLGI